LLMLTVIVAFVIVQPLHARFGKRETAVVTGIISVVFWITPFALRLADIWPSPGSALSTTFLMCFMFGSNVSGVIVMVSAQSMLADVVEASQVQTGRRTEGTFAAGWMFVQKCGTAFGIGITGLLVSLSGLPAKAIPGQVDPAVIDRLTIAYCVIVIVAAIGSTLVFRRFPITRADHEARIAALDAAARIDQDASGMHP
jgi:glycoside/pentoside/hexuronide:cation symporter, GPH family